MSSFIRYEQAPVDLKKGSSNACTLVASSVTAGENLPLQAVRALGYNGAVAVAANGPVEGTWSTTYALIKKAVTSKGCISSALMTPDADCDDFMSSSPLTWGSGEYISLKIGDANIFAKGLANSLSISIEPNAIVNATLGGNFYDGGITAKAGGIGAGTITAGNGTLSVGHGSKSTGAKLGFGCDPFSASYEASRGFNPIYSLGSLDAKFVMVTDPQQSMTLQGENLPTDLSSGSCVAPTNASMTVKDTCDNTVATLAVCGFVQSRDIEIAENDVLRGNITVVDYVGLQQSITSVSCS
jgi:hypothetical protein